MERRKATLALRATLVDRYNPTLSRRQRIPLHLPATYISLPEAERRALDLSHQLRTGTFTWEVWDTPTAAAATLTITDFREAAYRLLATKTRQAPERTARTWAKKWAPALNKLPLSGAITVPVLLRVLRSLPPESAVRRDQGTILAQIARSLGLDPTPIRELARGYGPAQLTERHIPSDEAIEAAWSQLRLPHWRWMFGMCATYGLRPHECHGLTHLPDNWIRVSDTTKTGARLVHPCPSTWLTTFQLDTLPPPTQSPSTLSRVFSAAMQRARIPFRAYALRHAYAIRLLVHGVPPELGARLMGHSLQMHQTTYLRWLEAHRITQALSRYTL